MVVWQRHCECRHLSLTPTVASPLTGCLTKYDSIREHMASFLTEGPLEAGQIIAIGVRPVPYWGSIQNQFPASVVDSMVAREHAIVSESTAIALLIPCPSIYLLWRLPLIPSCRFCLKAACVSAVNARSLRSLPLTLDSGASFGLC